MSRLIGAAVLTQIKLMCKTKVGVDDIDKLIDHRVKFQVWIIVRIKFFPRAN